MSNLQAHLALKKPERPASFKTPFKEDNSLALAGTASPVTKYPPIPKLTLPVLGKAVPKFPTLLSTSSDSDFGVSGQDKENINSSKQPESDPIPREEERHKISAIVNKEKDIEGKEDISQTSQTRKASKEIKYPPILKLTLPASKKGIPKFQTPLSTSSDNNISGLKRSSSEEIDRGGSSKIAKNSGHVKSTDNDKQTESDPIPREISLEEDGHNGAHLVVSEESQSRFPVHHDRDRLNLSTKPNSPENVSAILRNPLSSTLKSFQANSSLPAEPILSCSRSQVSKDGFSFTTNPPSTLPNVTNISLNCDDFNKNAQLSRSDSASRSAQSDSRDDEKSVFNLSIEEIVSDYDAVDNNNMKWVAHHVTEMTLHQESKEESNNWETSDSLNQLQSNENQNGARVSPIYRENSHSIHPQLSSSSSLHQPFENMELIDSQDHYINLNTDDVQITHDEQMNPQPLANQYFQNFDTSSNSSCNYPKKSYFQDGGSSKDSNQRQGSSGTLSEGNPGPRNVLTPTSSIDDFRKSFNQYSNSIAGHQNSPFSINQSAAPNDREYDDTRDEVQERILSIFFGNSCLGAAVYHTESNTLELLRDIPDNPPEFEMLEMLVYQVEPDKVLISARQDPEFVNIVKKVFVENDLNPTDPTLQTTTDSVVSAGETLPPQIVLRPGNEFVHKTCEQRLRMVNPPTSPGNRPCGDQERNVLLAAFVDFTCVSMVRAAGALMNYVDKNYRINREEEPDVVFMKQLTLNTILTVDTTSLTSLQIFSSQCQLSGSTAGSWNKRREGLSLFNVLNRCSSVVGSRFLRQMLRCPCGIIDIIKRRQHDIAFFCDRSNTTLCDGLAVSIKKVKNFQRLMKKLISNCMTLSDWHGVHRTIVGLVEIAQYAQNCNAEVYVMRNILYHVSEMTFNLHKLVDQVVDFKESATDGVLRVKPGVNEKLDEKRRLLNGLPDILNRVVVEEKEHLPAHFKACTICYLPHIGYLIAVPSNKALLESGVDYKNVDGLEFVFESNNTLHYRNTRTRGLDVNIGDVVLDITKLETQIISRLTEAILRNRVSLEKIVSYCAHLDCLLALSQVCKEHNWVQPEVTRSGGIVIKGGRHPLQEMTLNNFIANDTNMGSGGGGKVHLVTGPNSSGKSIYMKQVK